MATEKKSKKKGRPKTVITEQQQQSVVSMIQGGATQKDIAKHLGVSLNTLKKYCKDSIGQATAMRHGFVVGQLMTLIKKGNCTAIIFYLKTRCGWREPVEQEETKQIHEFVPTVKFDTIEEFTQYQAEVAKLKSEDRKDAKS